MVSVDLMRGEDWIRCCVCGVLHLMTPTGDWPFLEHDAFGDVWDMCASPCASKVRETNQTLRSDVMHDAVTPTS